MPVQNTVPVEENRVAPTRRTSLLEQRLQALRATVVGEGTPPREQGSPTTAGAASPQSVGNGGGAPHRTTAPLIQEVAPTSEMPSVLGSRSDPQVSAPTTEPTGQAPQTSSRRTIQTPDQAYQAPVFAPPAAESPTAGTPAPATLDGFGRDDASSSSAPLRVADTRSTTVGTDTLLSTDGPVLQVSTVGPESIVLGKQAMFRITVSNASDIEARDVTFSIPIPDHVGLETNEATSGQSVHEGRQGDGNVVWRLVQLPAHGRAELNLGLIPHDATPLDLQVAWTASASSRTAPITVLKPELELLISGPVDIVYGSSNVYAVVVSNPSQATAENVVLTLPPVADGQSNGGARMLGNIPAGEQRSVQFELTARQEGTLPVRATVVGDGGLSDETQRDVLVRRGVLELTLQGPGSRYAGTPAEYQVNIENTGNASADRVTVKAVLPQGSTFVSCSSGGHYDEELHGVEWEMGSLHPSGDHNLSVQCLLTTAGDNELNVQSQSDDGLNVFDTLVTHVEPIADVKLLVNDPPGPVQVGTDALYEVTVHNRGTKAAENVRVVAYFDEGVDPISVSGGQASINVAEGTVVFQTLDQLGPGEDITINITAQARVGGSLQFRAEVECSNPETRLAADESTVFYTLSTTNSSSDGASATPAPSDQPSPLR